MADLEKAIRILEQSYSHGVFRSKDELIPVTDIIVLLKAQEPRVMTLEEVITSKPGTVVWLEDYNKPDVISGLLKRLFIYTKVIDFLIVKEEVNNEVTADLDAYGTGWRCWTSRPIDAQREAVKWE